MKKKFLFGMVLVLMMILTKPITSQDHGFGMGIILGKPTGVECKTLNVKGK